MILVQIGNYNSANRVPDTIDLCYKIQGPVFNLLQYIYSTIGTMNIYIAGFLVDIRLIAVQAKFFPGCNKIRNGNTVCSGLNVVIASIKPSAYIQARNMLIRFKFSICRSSHTVPVKMFLV